MHQRQPTPRAPLPATCGITGHALVEATLAEIAGLRDGAGPPGAPALPPRFLRHSDEHTVVGLHAVLRALAVRNAAGDVSRHAVVAASCQAGRPAAARTLAGLAAGGGASVSTHVVPQCSLHSVAGAVSVGLGMRGPHLGIGGGSDAFAEGLFAAATLLHAAAGSGAPPCVWLVATEWDEEPAIDESGAVVGDPLVRGLALAIEPDPPEADASGGRARDEAARSLAAVARRAPSPTVSSLSLSLRVSDDPRPRVVTAVGRLAGFARALDMCLEGTALVAWGVECTGGAEIRVGVRRPVDSGRPAARLREAA